MHTLKTIVIALGVVLVAGFGLLIYGLTQNWHRTAGAPAASVTTARVPVAGATWGNIPVGTANERIAGVTASGELVVVHVTGDQGGRLVVVDPRNGRVVGTFVMGSAP
jgi:hypothetical protein